MTSRTAPLIVGWNNSVCSFPNCQNGTHAYDTEWKEFHCHQHYLENAYRLNKKRGNVVFRGPLDASVHK